MTSGNSSELSERALGLYTKTFEGSTIQDTSEDFPKFAFSELSLGKRLGEGGFGVVSEVLAFDLEPRKHEDSKGDTNNDPATTTEDAVEISNNANPYEFDDDPDMQGRKFIAEHCIRDDNARYAIKILKKSLVDKGDDKLLVKAMADMAVETHILSAIEHPNIVKLRGCSLQGRYQPEYFIVMDRLYDTLEKRLEQWAALAPPKPVKPPAMRMSLTKKTTTTTTAQTKPKSGGIFACLFGGGKKQNNVVVVEEEEILEQIQEMHPAVRASTIRASVNHDQVEKEKKLLEERLVACFDLASAMGYLHKRNIIYRDIKPENCAFDVRGDIKLFDFGTAKELPQQNEQRDKTFHLTGMTGSLPWMAPEVAKSIPYNHKADIFSFAILLWQVMALEMPFKKYESDLRLFWEEVHNGAHKRPEIPHGTWPKPVELCMTRGWADNPSERMEMTQIESILRMEIIRVRKGDAAGLQHDRRRSTFVFRRQRMSEKVT